MLNIMWWSSGWYQVLSLWIYKSTLHRIDGNVLLAEVQVLKKNNNVL